MAGGRSNHRNRGLGRRPHHSGHHPGERADFPDSGGSGAKVEAGEPLLYVVESGRCQCGLRVSKGAEPRGPHKTRRWTGRRSCWIAGAIAAKDYESNVADYNDATTDVQNSLQALKIFGITQQEIDDAEQQGKPITPELAVRAPIAGTMVQKLVSPGQFIQAGMTACFMLSNASTVWVQGHIFDRDLPSIKIGDEVERDQCRRSAGQFPRARRLYRSIRGPGNADDAGSHRHARILRDC